MTDAYVRMERLLEETQGERIKQIESVGKFVQMLDLGSKKRVKAEAGVQTDLALIKHTQPDLLRFQEPRDSELITRCFHPFGGLLGFLDGAYANTSKTLLEKEKNALLPEKTVFSMCENFMNLKYRAENEALSPTAALHAHHIQHQQKFGGQSTSIER